MILKAGLGQPSFKAIEARERAAECVKLSGAPDSKRPANILFALF